MISVTQNNVSVAIEEGSWFVLYAVRSPAGFRCDLETKTAPMLTVIFGQNDFVRLERMALDAGKPSARARPLYVTSICHLTISADQRDEFFKAYQRITSKLNLHIKEQPDAGF